MLLKTTNLNEITASLASAKECLDHKGVVILPLDLASVSLKTLHTCHGASSEILDSVTQEYHARAIQRIGGDTKTANAIKILMAKLKHWGTSSCGWQYFDSILQTGYPFGYTDPSGEIHAPPFSYEVEGNPQCYPPSHFYQIIINLRGAGPQISTLGNDYTHQASSKSPLTKTVHGVQPHQPCATIINASEAGDLILPPECSWDFYIKDKPFLPPRLFVEMHFSSPVIVMRDEYNLNL